MAKMSSLAKIAKTPREMSTSTVAADYSAGGRDYKQLNFRVKAKFREEFEQFCEEHDMKLVDALTNAFRLYKKTYKPED